MSICTKKHKHHETKDPCENKPWYMISFTKGKKYYSIVIKDGNIYNNLRSFEKENGAKILMY